MIICFINLINYSWAIYNDLVNFIALFHEPEYIALILSTLAIATSVYISYRDRRYMLAKEEYFKHQQTVEKIVAKIMIVEYDRTKYSIWIRGRIAEYIGKKTKFIDTNDTFNNDLMEKNAEEVAALICIYFPELSEKRNNCLTIMGRLLSQIIELNEKIQNREEIDRQEEFKKFQLNLEKLGDQPKEIVSSIIESLNEFKRKELQ